MDLGVLVDNLAIDTIFLLGSFVTDGISTYAAMKKYGQPAIDAEINDELKTNINQEGIGKAILNHNKKWIAITLMASVATYGVDSFFGIEENIVNIHHYVNYVTGTLKYLCALKNTSLIFDWQNINKITSYPVEQYSKFTGFITNKTPPPNS